MQRDAVTQAGEEAVAVNSYALRSIPLLAALDSRQLDELARHVVIRRYAKGRHVINKGSSGDALLFLLEGKLQAIDLTEDGKEIGLNFILPGNFFGELALIDGLPRSASVVAIEPSSVAILPRRPALDIIYGNPLIAEAMLKHFAATIRRLTTWRGLLAIGNAQQRFYAMLCRLMQRHADGRGGILELPTQREIAIMLNTSRETISRALTALERQNIIVKVRSRYFVVRRPEQLEKLAAIDRYLAGEELLNQSRSNNLD